MGNIRAAIVLCWIAVCTAVRRGWAGLTGNIRAAAVLLLEYCCMDGCTAVHRGRGGGWAGS